MATDPEAEDGPRPRAGALGVAGGILASRVFGLLRETLTAYFFGVGAYADVWRAASRAPNALQNLLGEQTLSAAFIPIYSRLLAEGRREEAGRFAGAIFGLLAAAASLLALAGYVLAPWLVAVLTPGFLGDAAQVAAGTLAVDRYPLLVAAVRVLFPMTGFLVLSAWALGVLNSHRRFLLSYSAPVLWNLSILAFLVVAAWRSGRLASPEGAPHADLERWLFAACWGGLVGGLLQFLVQLPAVLKLCRGLRLSLSTRVEGVRAALAAAGPALAGRGVVQLSLYLDIFIASQLITGAPGAIGLAGVLMSLPISLFGMSVAAAELPELARQDPATAQSKISERISRGLRQTGFVIWPSAVAFLCFGYLVVGALFRYGSFRADAHGLVTCILAAYALGLPASTGARLLQNSFFAVRDTATPARIATLRLVVAAGLGLLLGKLLDGFAVASIFSEATGSKLAFGAVGLALGSSVGAWLEYLLLGLRLRRRLPALRLPSERLAVLGGLAMLAALPAAGIHWLLRDGKLIWVAPSVLAVYAIAYFLLTRWAGATELDLWLEHPRLARFRRHPPR